MASHPSWLFFRRFLAHPDRLASLFASSPALGRRIAAELQLGEGDCLLELGAGTGAVTSTLLEAGVPREKLLAVEIDPEMAAFLRARFPGLKVLEADAFDLAERLPVAGAGRIGAVVCGLPLSLLPHDRQAEMVALILALLPAGQPFLAYCHRLGAPLPAARLGLTGRRLAFTLRNLPPASVWAFWPSG